MLSKISRREIFIFWWSFQFGNQRAESQSPSFFVETWCTTCKLSYCHDLWVFVPFQKFDRFEKLSNIDLNVISPDFHVKSSVPVMVSVLSSIPSWSNSIFRWNFSKPINVNFKQKNRNARFVLFTKTWFDWKHDLLVKRPVSRLEADGERNGSSWPKVLHVCQ